MPVQIGARPSGTETALTNGKTFALGQKHTDQAGNVFVYVRASVAFTLGDCIAIKANYQACPMTDALSKTVSLVGVASKVAFTLLDYGWVQTEGAFDNLRVAIDCEPAKPLYITATAGVLDDATLSSMIAGIQITTSATAAGAFAATGKPFISWGANLSQI